MSYELEYEVINSAPEKFHLVDVGELNFSNLKRNLDSMGRSLSIQRSLENDYQIAPPPFLLAKPITPRQKLHIDAILGPVYARRGVEVQNNALAMPIKEENERMVDLRQLFKIFGHHTTFSDLPFASACGEWAGKPRVFWLREAMAQRLSTLSIAFQTVGIAMHFEDAWRPMGVQEGLFMRRLDWIIKEHPDWSAQAVWTEARSKTADSAKLASHKSGGAVDLTLRHLSDGSPLDLGNNYPDGGALVSLDCPFVSPAQWQTRQIFANALRMVGLAVYPGEDWHGSFRDNLHALVTRGIAAAYGPIKTFDYSTGKILEVYSEAEMNQAFCSMSSIEDMIRRQN